MKKFLSILLAAMMMMTVLCAAALAEEDDVPQTEAGKKFDTTWAMTGGVVTVDYEEVGYRVAVNLCNPMEGTGCVWEYSCYYHEDTDSLEAVSAMKTPYTIDPLTGEENYGEALYDILVEEGSEVSFTISENGSLIWNDGIGNDGADLEFRKIGRFEGSWINEAEEVDVKIMWNGLDEDEFFYTVYLRRGGAEAYTEFLMNGVYNPETDKLECLGTATSFTLVDGEFVPGEDDGESYEAFFSVKEDGGLLYEAANGIDLEYNYDEGDLG